MSSMGVVWIFSRIAHCEVWKEILLNMTVRVAFELASSQLHGNDTNIMKAFFMYV